MDRPEDLAYTAGIIDGEGNIRLNKAYKSRCYTPLLTVTNTNPIITDWLQFFYGGSVGVYKSGKANWKPSYYWRLCGVEVVNLLKLVKPYIKLKVPQVELILKFWELHEEYGVHSCVAASDEYIDKSLKLFEIMGNLNLKGC